MVDKKEIADKLKQAGYNSSEKIAGASVREITEKTGLDKEVAQKIVERAKLIQSQTEDLKKKIALEKPIKKLPQVKKKPVVRKKPVEKKTKIPKVNLTLIRKLGKSPEFRSLLLERAIQNPVCREKIIAYTVKKLTQ